MFMFLFTICNQNNKNKIVAYITIIEYDKNNVQHK